MKYNPDFFNGVTKYVLNEEFYFLLGFLFISVFIFFITKKYINSLLIRIICRKNPTWAGVFKRNNTFLPFACLVPILFFMTSAQYLPTTWEYIERFLSASVVLLVTLVVASLVNTINHVYEIYPISKEKPAKSYAQLTILLVYIFGGIITICELLDKSPTIFLGGAVAVMAAILLVFRDTILSFIASMQLATNNLIQKGDWIEVKSFGADGTVIDIALHVVRIQNFDNTIVTIPTYKIMESGFRNWRGMYESGARQIKKSILIDQNSIRFMREDDFKIIYEHAMVKDHLPSFKEILKAHNEKDKTCLTNLGVLRTYIECYLKSNSKIHQKMTLLVRILEPTPNGIPLQIYAYVNDTRWPAYEEVQADIIEHVVALLKIFDLRVYQNMMDTDFQTLDRIGQQVLMKGTG